MRSFKFYTTIMRTSENYKSIIFWYQKVHRHDKRKDERKRRVWKGKKSLRTDIVPAIKLIKTSDGVVEVSYIPLGNTKDITIKHLLNSRNYGVIPQSFVQENTPKHSLYS